MKKILIIDIETTHFLHYGGKIVEIGIVELDLSNGNRSIIFNKLVREDNMTIPELENSWIVKNSDLSCSDVLGADSLEKIRPEVQKILSDYADGATAFNNEFDFGFLENRGFTFPKKLACPMKLSTNIVKAPSPGGRAGYKWPKVKEAWDFFFGNTGYVEKHRGADDAYHEAAIVYELYKRGIFTVN